MTERDTAKNNTFAGVRRVDTFRITRRNLPQWQNPGSVYFVTWRTHRSPQLSPANRTAALDAVKHWDGVRWKVYAALIMPDHVHLLVQPLRIQVSKDNSLKNTFHDLGAIVHSVKSYSAHTINRQNRSSGAVWLDERHDRIVRSDVELQEKWQYIVDNPVKAGLVDRVEDYAWYYRMSG